MPCIEEWLLNPLLLIDKKIGENYPTLYSTNIKLSALKSVDEKLFYNFAVHCLIVCISRYLSFLFPHKVLGHWCQVG